MCVTLSDNMNALIVSDSVWQLDRSYQSFAALLIVVSSRNFAWVTALSNGVPHAGQPVDTRCDIT